MPNDGKGQASVMHAVFDEAGDTGRGSLSSRYMVVAGLACNNLEALRRVVARTRKQLGKDLRSVPELKAAHTPAKTVTYLLNHLALLDLEVYAAVLDKSSVPLPKDTEDWYRKLFSECVRLVLADRSGLLVTIDQRYTKASLRDQLVQSIAADVYRPGTTLSFVLADSQREKAIQAADAVAWCIFQKYERQNLDFYHQIEKKVMAEVLLLR